MDTRTSDGKKEVGTYLGFTFGLSAIFWALIISGGSLGVHGGIMCSRSCGVLA